MRLLITIIAAITVIATVTAQVPNVTGASTVRLTENNKIFSRSVAAMHRAEDTLYVVLAGQSNAWGATAPFQGDTTSSPHVEAWDGSAWVRAEIGNEPFRTPANNPSSSSYDNSNCLGLHFCKKLAEETGHKVRLILNVADGNAIATWIPQSDVNYAALEDLISDAGVSEVDVFLWHQGEADNAQTESYYTLKFDTLKQQLRTETWFPTTTPIVVGGLLPGGTQSNQTTTLEKFDYDDDVWVAYATSEDLVNNGIDNIHFHGTSLVEFGAERYWQAYMSLPMRHTERGWAPTNGTVTSVDVSGGTTGLSFTGGPITTSGTITASGTLVVANGGTGQTSLANNSVLTGNGTSGIVAETNLTYDGTTLLAATNTNAATNNLVVYNSNAGSGAVGALRFWNNSSTSSTRGFVSQLASSAFSSPYGSSQIHWLYENANQIWATNNGARMMLNASGNLYIGGAVSGSEKLHVSGNGYITGNFGIGVNPALTRLHVAGISNSTLLVESSNTVGTTFEIKNTDTGGGDFTFSVAGSANSYAAGSFIGYDFNASATRYWINPSGYFGITAATTLSGKLHVTGSGATSGTNTALFENSAGTDILTVRDDQMSAFGTTPVSTEKLLVRGATSDNTTKAFVAERSSGTDVLGVQNDGKVSINNAAYTEALTVNGNTQTDMLVLTNQTASTATGKVVYDNGSGGTYSGTLSLGDGTHALVVAPTLIERHVIDYLVNWSTGRKGAFWTVPARFDGYKIAKAYISVTAIGAGAGDDELTIEIGGVGEGVQVITAGTHTLVMNDVINTDDVITFNITAISATPAQGLHVSFELSKL